ncbi:MAG TPA: hypothetical protein VEQ63_03565 [Bryobacteraceae bacterium]|nr:hypothetical protein [Bryobacteraceae bacterium]
MIARILRVYSYLFHLVLALFLLGMAIVANVSNSQLRLDVLPWKGEELTQWLLWGSIAGLISTILAMTGVFPFLFPIWAFVVLAMMIRGFLLQPYTYASRGEFYNTLWLIGAALLAFIASLTAFRMKRRRFR